MAILEQMTSSYSMETGNNGNRYSQVLSSFQGRDSVLKCSLSRPEYRMETEGDRYFDVGVTLYWGISYYFPSDFDEGEFTIIMQTHNFPKEPETTYPLGGGGHKISARNGKLYYDFQYAKNGTGAGEGQAIELYSVSQLRGKWLDLVCKIRHSGNTDGIFQLYGMLDNSGVYSELVNKTNVRTWWNNESDAYFKFGIYKGSGNSDWSGQSPCVVYCNDYRLGNGGFDEVKPRPGTIGGSQPPVEPPPPPPPPTAQDNTYIEVGGTRSTTVSGKTYAVDSGYRTGGTTRSVSHYSNPVYNTYVIGSHSYSIPVVSGNTYNVKLLMSEVFHQAANLRKFDISINGNQVENDLDLYAVSGYQQEFSKTYQVTANSNTLSIVLTTVLDNAILMGIEVEKTTGGTTPPPPPPPTGNKIVTRINAGANDVGRFGQDDHYTGGFTYSQTQTKTVPSAYSSEAAIYNTERNGSIGFSYAIPATAGQAYTVRLHFCDLRPASETRTMNVDIQGSRVLSNYNPKTEAGGVNIGFFRDFQVTPSGSTINVNFQQVSGRCYVNAIECF